MFLDIGARHHPIAVVVKTGDKLLRAVPLMVRNIGALHHQLTV